MGTQISRDRRQTWFILKFKEARKEGRSINKKKFLADFCLEMLCSKRTAQDMLRIFEDAGQIEFKHGRIEVLRI